MRAYGYKKSTEFTRKQIGVIFANAKKGNLNVEQWVMKDFYDLADYYGYDDNRNVEHCEFEIKNILAKVFANDFKKAQELIDLYTTSNFDCLSYKLQKKANRNFV